MAETEKVVLCSGEEVEIFEGSRRKDIQQFCNWSKKGFIKPVNGKRIFPREFLRHDRMIYNFPFRSSDVFVNGFLKSGTTWVQEIVWTILFNTNLDNPLQKENVFIRIPWFEGDICRNVGEEWFYESISRVYNISLKPNFMDMFEGIPNRRIFKCHLYPSTINKKMLDVSKIVYVVRNPMDSCYSYYWYHRYTSGVLGLIKDWSEFADIYIRGEVYSGNGGEHILNWWPYRNHKNLYMIFYEKIKEDPTGEIRKLAQFLERELTDKEIKNVIYQTSFNKMKEVMSETETGMNEAVGNKESKGQSSFFRKGNVGDSKGMPKDAYNKLSAHFKETLKDLDLPYTFMELQSEPENV